MAAMPCPAGQLLTKAMQTRNSRDAMVVDHNGFAAL